MIRRLSLLIHLINIVHIDTVSVRNFKYKKTSKHYSYIIFKLGSIAVIFPPNTFMKLQTCVISKFLFFNLFLKIKSQNVSRNL